MQDTTRIRGSCAATTRYDQNVTRTATSHSISATDMRCRCMIHRTASLLVCTRVVAVMHTCQTPLQSSLPTVWPNFDVSGVPNGTQCLSWGEHYFFPGTVGPRVPHTNPKPADLRQCSGGGPLFFFTKPAAGGGAAAAMALSPLSHFSSNMISGAGANFTGLGVDAAGGHCGGSKRCQYFPTEGALGCSGATSSSCRWLCGRSLLLCKVCLGVCLQF